MADLKISALTGATTPLAGTEVLPIVQSSTTKKVSIANLTAGRDVSTANLFAVSPDGTKQIAFVPGNATNQILGDYSSGGNIPLQIGLYTIPAMLKFETTGDVTVKNNLVQGTAAKGINFTANTPAAGMTSQLINWYEEGTWTPGAGNQTVVGTYTSNGNYTRIGRQVFFRGQVIGATSIAGAAGTYITGLPFTSVKSGTGSGTIANQTAGAIIFVGPGDTIIYIIGGYAATSNFEFSGMYFV
jgi:hypothetical protein